MFTLTIKGETAEQLLQLGSHVSLNALSGAGFDVRLSTDGNTESEPSAPAEPVKAKKAKAAPAAEAAPAPAATPAAPAATPAAPAADAVPYTDVQKAIIDLANGKGRETVLATLKPFGVTKGQELKPEQYADAIKACQKALAAADEAEDEDDLA